MVWPPAKAVWRARGLAAHARAGRGAGVGWRAAWWQRAPTPLVGRCAPWLDEWSFTGRAVCCRAPVAGRVLLPLTARRGSGAPWQWPAPGSRRRLPVAAALFLPPQDAQCNPGGATSRAGLAALGAPAHPGHGLLRQDWGTAQEGGRKRKMPQQPAAFAARGRTACFTPRRHGKIWRSGGSTGTRRCTAAAHSPQKNPLDEDC